MLDSSDNAKCNLVASALSSGQRVRIRALGVSMVPAIWPGDTLAIEPISIKQIAKDDVVVFTREGRLFAHRVQRTDVNGEVVLITRGDRMSQADLPVRPKDYLGQVVSITRSGREFQLPTNTGRLHKLLSWLLRWNRALALYLRVARILRLTDYSANTRSADTQTLRRTT